MFNNYESVKNLKMLAKNPVDLTTYNNFEERIKDMYVESGNLRLIYFGERVNEEVIENLTLLARESSLLSKMHEMQSGAMINTSENRAVLHTAMRDFFEDRNSSEKAWGASEKALKEMHKLKDFLNDIELKNFTDLVMIGIGGSDLGPRALYMAMQPYRIENRNVHFISNVDPDDAAQVMRCLDLKHTLVLVVSKSGTTLETLTNEELVKEYFIKSNLNVERHFVAVTGEGSPMDDPKKYLASFYIWDYVGGRYSATSMVGGVMLGFALGYDNYLDILRGASAMDKIALKENIKDNLPLFSALLGIWNHNFLGYETVAIIPYSQALVRFTAHLQQCDMESNGKSVDKKGNLVDYQTGPIIWGEPGTNAQHSFYQLIHQGTTTVPVEFIGFCESQYGLDINIQGTSSQEKLLANLFAQSIALSVGKKNENNNKMFPGNRPNRILMAKKLDPYTMGMLLSYYEHKIAFQGFAWGINSFDQEGVQLGKVLANKILNVFKDEDCDDFLEGKSIIKHYKDIVYG